MISEIIRKRKNFVFEGKGKALHCSADWIRSMNHPIQAGRGMEKCIISFFSFFPFPFSVDNHFILSFRPKE